jgi:hypothetical protein
MHNNLKAHIPVVHDTLELLLDSAQQLERDLFAFIRTYYISLRFRLNLADFLTSSSTLS